MAYTARAADVERLLPVSSTVVEAEGKHQLSRSLAAALQRRPPKHFDLQFATLASLDGRSDAIVFAAAVDRESWTVERIAGKYKLLFEIAAEALFFDFRERQILFAYPITLQYIEVLDRPPGPSDLQAAAHRLLFGTASSSLQTVLPAEIHTLALPGSSSRRLQVVSVDLSEQAAAKIPEHQRDPALIGHEFTKILASTWRLPMLPHARGQAIGGAMAARFDDGRIFNLSIPEPDYRIVLGVDDFRQKTLSETPAVRQQLYGAFFSVLVEEPLSGKAYFSQALRQGGTKIIPASQDMVDSAAAYYETLLAGLSSFAQAANGEAKTWADEQPGGREFRQQMKTFKELIQLCR